MKIVYLTDPHGDEQKYYLILEIAKKIYADAVILGGDLFPTDKDGDLINIQNNFINNIFRKFCEYADRINIKVFCCLGNDDLICNDGVFKNIINDFRCIYNITKNVVSLNGFNIIGFDLVVDYPFRLKDRCRLDSEYDLPPELKNNAYLTLSGFWERISDWPSKIKSLPLLTTEMENLPKPKSYDKAIYVIHMPPILLGFDVCYHGGRVGSSSVYSFLERYQPLLSLHGHIHESPEYSQWQGNIGKTICIQPGQSQRDMVYTLIEITDNIVSAKRYIKRL